MAEHAIHAHTVDGKGEPGYERRDANVWAVVGVGAGLGAVVIVSMVVLGVLRGRVEPLGRTPTPGSVEAGRAVMAWTDLRALLAARRELSAQRLGSYGVVDGEEGVAHIPIDEAMRLYAERHAREQEGGRP